jgi:2-polyprenyl-6-methoxyphenol hydroxylase-like FAD-dependent oxidoreductase
MEQSLRNSTEVLIVGAGPTGLMMACQLAFHGVAFRIVDKNSTSSQNSGALIVQARTLEIFEQMGLASEAIKAGIVADRIDILYNGRKIAGTSIKDIGRNLSQFPFLLMLEQSETEKLLLKYFNERGCNVERNVQFKSFKEDKTGITTELIMPDGSGETVVSKYLIGADGSRSAIRNFLKIPFEGKRYPKPIFILDCGAITDISSGAICFAFSRNSVAGFFPLRNQRWRVDGSFPESVNIAETIQLETVAEGLQHWNNLKFEMHGTEWFSVSHSQQKYAQTIRIGNCFLAGDSAHVNTPVGAQGMNTGLQDAHNLAWKLAFVLKQKAKPDLPDSYSHERLGVSQGFARYADVVFRLVTNTNTAVRFFRTFILKMYFKRIFPGQVKNEKARQKFFKAISQTDIHYKSVFLTEKATERLFSQDSPKPGYRLPYVEFSLNKIKTHSHKLPDPLWFTILVFAEELTMEINSLASRYKLKVVLIKNLPETQELYAAFGINDSGYYLIRPDAYIAFRSATMDSGHLDRYLEHIFGDG